MASGVSNGDLSDLLRRAGAEEAGHRRRALERASRAARFWPREATELTAAGGSLTDLSAVGPWVAERLQAWIAHPPALPDPDERRRGYLTLSQVRRVLDADRAWEATPHADLQVHSTDSDGSLSLTDMAFEAKQLGRTFIASTDHSKSLRIANGMDEQRLADQGRRIDALNAEFSSSGDPFRVLRSIEMDVFTDGTADMEPAALAPLDLVLDAFHTKLRLGQDQTDRYLAALRNPSVHVLAHPKTRMFGRRAGLQADWSRVFDEAARLNKAVELDATPYRQDLDATLARIAVAAGVEWFSIGSDAHSASELEFLPFGMAAAALAGIPRSRILNYAPVADVLRWAQGVKGR